MPFSCKSAEVAEGDLGAIRRLLVHIFVHYNTNENGSSNPNALTPSPRANTHASDIDHAGAGAVLSA